MMQTFEPPHELSAPVTMRGAPLPIRQTGWLQTDGHRAQLRARPKGTNVIVPLRFHPRPSLAIESGT